MVGKEICFHRHHHHYQALMARRLGTDSQPQLEKTCAALVVGWNECDKRRHHMAGISTKIWRYASPTDGHHDQIVDHTLGKHLYRKRKGQQKERKVY